MECKQCNLLGLELMKLDARKYSFSSVTLNFNDNKYRKCKNRPADWNTPSSGAHNKRD